MAVKITDIEIACDSCLDENLFSDVNQEVGFIGEEKLDFFNYEEQKDFLEPQTIDPNIETQMYVDELMEKGAREAAGFC